MNAKRPDPIDWEQPIKYVGISKRLKDRGYIVSLSLCHRQYHWGPFYDSQLQAANMHDRLVRYFIAFVKTTPKINTIAQSFAKLDNKETEALLDCERLHSLRVSLRLELTRAGFDEDVEAGKRIDYIMGFAKLSAPYRATGTLERRGLRKLQALHKCHAKMSDAWTRTVDVLGQCDLTPEQLDSLRPLLNDFENEHTQTMKSFGKLINAAHAIISPDSI